MMTMSGEFLGFLKTFCSKLGFDGIFYIFCGIETVVFTVCFIILSLSRKVRKKDLKICFILSSAINFSTMQGLFSLQKEYITEVLFFTFFSVALILLFYLLVLLKKDKFCKPKKEERALIKKLGERAEQEKFVYVEQKEKPFICEEKPKGDFSLEEEKEYADTPQLKEKECELDFSHVKNILKRLEYYNLSSLDTKQVSELKSALYQAETCGVNKDIKSKINDGLGALLKIMSKYGV